jgi:NAD(P)-dependent dehydrogenase (short-subunit alcohol dehydrogenase family)
MNLSGKTVVLTGATTGIGRAATLALADQPARLVIHGPQAAREVSGLTHSLQAAMQPGAELTYLHSEPSKECSIPPITSGQLSRRLHCRGSSDRPVLRFADNSRRSLPVAGPGKA